MLSEQALPVIPQHKEDSPMASHARERLVSAIDCKVSIVLRMQTLFAGGWQAGDVFDNEPDPVRAAAWIRRDEELVVEAIPVLGAILLGEDFAVIRSRDLPRKPCECRYHTATQVALPLKVSGQFFHRDE
jgi:hypothetical protein